MPSVIWDDDSLKGAGMTVFEMAHKEMAHTSNALPSSWSPGQLVLIPVIMAKRPEPTTI